MSCARTDGGESHVSRDCNWGGVTPAEGTPCGGDAAGTAEKSSVLDRAEVQVSSYPAGTLFVFARSAAGVQAPAVGSPVGGQPARTVSPSADGGEPEASGDRHWLWRPLCCASAQLPPAVRSPAIRASVNREPASVGITGADGGEPKVSGHRHGRWRVVGCAGA